MRSVNDNEGRMKNSKIQRYIVIVLVMLVALSGCGNQVATETTEQVMGYRSISQDEAKRMMEQDGSFIIVDVRREDEYAEGHIPGAILIPNESINQEPPKELPEKDQVILVYCRSGRRSKEASQKLADMGYTHVYEFGGIIDWTGETEIMGITTEEQYDMTPTAIVGVRVGDNFFTIDLEDNSSADEFFEKIDAKPLTVEMKEYGGFEKVGELPWELPTNDEQITTKPGDIILYQGNKITVYYGENTWNLTKLGSISGHTPEDIEMIKDAFGGAEDVTAEFFVEWTE